MESSCTNYPTSHRALRRGWKPLWAVLTLLMNCAIPATLALICCAGSAALAQEPGSIEGKVTDSSGSPVYGAIVVVENAQGARHTTVTDGEGAFRISSLAPGSYDVKVSASGFSDWTASSVAPSVTPESNSVSAVLEVAPHVTEVTVGLPPDEVAAEQVSQEVKQRTLKIIPNYYVSYEAHPAPLSPKLKLQLAYKSLFDPTTIVAMGAVAGYQQARNSYYEWGQGAEGYAKRFGAAYGTAVISLATTGVVLDSLLRQDPRYFYSGQGTKMQRVGHILRSTFETKGDNGKWQPPYAGFIGSIAVEEIANTYYPSSRSQISLIGRGLALHFGGLLVVNTLQEFVLKDLTKHRPVAQYPNGSVLRAGTAVRLLAVDGLSVANVDSGRTLTFVLEDDLTVSGKLLVKKGEVATGLVAEVSRAKQPDEPMNVTLDRAALRVGNVVVPLRSSQVQGVAAPMQYREVPESGKVEVMLFVAQDVQFPEVQ